MHRCKHCNCVLTNKFFSLEKTPIVNDCEPEDKESLFSVYCEVLRHLQPLTTTQRLSDQITAQAVTIKKTNKIQLSSKIDLLLSKIRNDLADARQLLDQAER